MCVYSHKCRNFQTCHFRCICIYICVRIIVCVRVQECRNTQACRMKCICIYRCQNYSLMLSELNVNLLVCFCLFVPPPTTTAVHILYHDMLTLANLPNVFCDVFCKCLNLNEFQFADKLEDWQCVYAITEIALTSSGQSATVCDSYLENIYYARNFASKYFE